MDWAMGIGGFVILAYSLYARGWVPIRGVKLLAQRLEALPESDRVQERKSWVVRHALLQAAAVGVFVGVIVAAGLAAGAWESTWRHQVGAFAVVVLLPISAGLGGWVYYHFQARRTLTPELSPIVQVPIGHPVSSVDREYLQSRYRPTVLRCLAVSLVPAFLVLTAIPMLGGHDVGDPATGTIAGRMLVPLGVMALIPLVVVPFQRFFYGPRVVKPAVNPAAAIIANSVAEYAMWAISPLMGYVIFFMGGTWIQFGASIALAIVGWLFTFPRLSRWMVLADQQDQWAAASVVR